MVAQIPVRLDVSMRETSVVWIFQLARVFTNGNLARVTIQMASMTKGTRDPFVLVQMDHPFPFVLVQTGPLP